MPLPSIIASTSRARVVAALAVTACVAAVAACGTPPQPLPTAPPRSVSSELPSTDPSGYPTAGPTLAVPGGDLSTVPGLPPGTAPVTALPTPPPQTRVPTTAAPTPTTPPAPPCHGGPSAAQVLAAVKDYPGLPTGQTLQVQDGPFCAGDWQFTSVVPATGGPDVDPLLVVTKGQPAALTVIEAGADVCSDQVKSEAPPGIKVLAFCE